MAYAHRPTFQPQTADGALEMWVDGLEGSRGSVNRAVGTDKLSERQKMGQKMKKKEFHLAEVGGGVG